MDFYCDEVLTGRVTIRRVAETDHVLAFHHTQPYWPVHIVVIPKRHIESLAKLAPEDASVVQEMLTVAADICRTVTETHGGCRLSTNNGVSRQPSICTSTFTTAPASVMKTARPQVRWPNNFRWPSQTTPGLTAPTDAAAEHPDSPPRS